MLVESFSDFEVVGEAKSGRAALALVREHDPDVALVKVTMPELDGIEVTARAKAERARTRVVLYSLDAGEEQVRRALLAGAAGYLVKSSEAAELELALRAAARGEVWLGPDVSKSLLDGMSQGATGREAKRLEVLTRRQREILQLVAEGQSTKEIATTLGLRPKTVESHRAQLMQRLGVRGVPALVRAAIRFGVVTSED
jgi:DNA-binding NarL/FixJ family response regulator